MTPAPFDYVRPETLDEALRILAGAGDEARPLAGGQSLVPLLATRLARPSIVVDIGRIMHLSGAADEANGRLAVGALTRHRDVIRCPVIAAKVPLLPRAARDIAHPGVRNLGTLGGAVALGDPSAEYPACAIALGADVRLASTTGIRDVPAEVFFKGPMTTEARPDELVTGLICMPLGLADRFGFHEITERKGDYALAGAAIATRTHAAGTRTVRSVLFGIADRPFPVPDAAAILADVPLDAWNTSVLAEAAAATRNALALEGVAADRRHLGGVALARAACDLAASETLA